ncbi:MAG: energy transducer TonB [Rikenellaceae bacterium]|nr:energy transducer TonB [Rikenellaceae bacterium]
MKTQILIAAMLCMICTTVVSVSAEQAHNTVTEQQEPETVELSSEPLFRYWKKDGVEEFKQWFARQLTTIPSYAQGSGTVGEMVVSFIVDTEGKVIDIEVNSSTHPQRNGDIKEIIAGSPVWKAPAYDAAMNPVPFKVVMPVRFQLGSL